MKRPIKPSKANKIQELQKELESLGDDVEVIELQDNGGGFVGFKIGTPLHTYLDSARPEDIIELVKRDIELYKTSRCFACGKPVDMMDSDGYGNGFCPSCRSMFGSIAKNFARTALDIVSEKFGDKKYDILIHILVHWHELFVYDRNRGYCWFLFGKIDPQNIESVAETIKTTLPTITGITTINVPLFENIDEPDDPECRRYASCHQCIHNLEMQNESGWIIGLESSFCGGDSIRLCCYPHLHKKVIENLGFTLEYQPEKMRGYRTHDDGIVWNAFVGECLDLFVDVDHHEHLEGQTSNGEFIQPICPLFVIDQENIDLEDNGGPYRILREEPVTFGLVNYERIKKEAEAKRKEEKLNVLRQKCYRLKEDKLIKSILSLRIENNRVFDSNRKKVVDCLVEHFTIEELQLIESSHFNFRHFLNTSNTTFQPVVLDAIKKAG